ncbi:hypothetical protein XaC1_4 [Xanthomonas phage XaC1]|nr:hypothetical protein XaC1_4 [Xanthomonas phage XaC1]
MTNVNVSTGISYGVINANVIDGDVLHNISFGSNSIDITMLSLRIDHAQSQEDINFVLPVISLSESANRFYNRVQEALDATSIDWDSFYTEHEEINSDVYSAIVDGCEVLYSTDSNTITVIDSPYTDKFARCSPCYPGAGDLNTRDNDGINTYTVPSDWIVA